MSPGTSLILLLLKTACPKTNAKRECGATWGPLLVIARGLIWHCLAVTRTQDENQSFATLFVRATCTHSLSNDIVTRGQLSTQTEVCQPV